MPASSPTRRRPSRYLADTLSAGNLVCGALGIAAAANGRPDLSLGLLLLGGALDGADGVAARRFGSSRFGVLSDDIADGVTNGLMPGAAIGLLVGGGEGWLLGGLYALATITRLVFFTLRKGVDDPGTFGGLPSTAGALLVLAGLVLMPSSTAVLGGLVGLSAALMLGFGFSYPHLGRRVVASRSAQTTVVACVAVLAGSGLVFGPQVPAAMLLAGGLAYGLSPVARALVRAARPEAPELSQGAQL